ncbi:unnamed protein product [Caenorhabditis auriculariae]|uniref:Ubiquitin-like protease family profile domain-containing protein n=1 Tax=Caenorhabditis auriculariae TaxID=2777116 RepID=A0A8S1HFJ2_9PELO|nr:unnamed protein product [Caenorhabditis auriculariae]
MSVEPVQNQNCPDAERMTPELAKEFLKKFKLLEEEVPGDFYVLLACIDKRLKDRILQDEWLESTHLVLLMLLKLKASGKRVTLIHPECFDFVRKNQDLKDFDLRRLCFLKREPPYGKIVIPMITGTHWQVAVACVETPRIVFYDSVGEVSMVQADVCARILAYFFDSQNIPRVRFNIEYADGKKRIKQDDTKNCGLFCIYYAEGAMKSWDVRKAINGKNCARKRSECAFFFDHFLETKACLLDGRDPGPPAIPVYNHRHDKQKIVPEKSTSPSQGHAVIIDQQVIPSAPRAFETFSLSSTRFGRMIGNAFTAVSDAAQRLIGRAPAAIAAPPPPAPSAGEIVETKNL